MMKLTLLFFIFLTQLASGANYREAIKSYDFNLFAIAKQTESFIDAFSPQLENYVRAGERMGLTYLYSPYKDKTLGVDGQSIENLKATNETELGLITKSTTQMNMDRLSPDEYLSLNEASALLSSSSLVIKKHIDSLRGPCFMRATHLAHKIGLNFPKVPILKFWLFGSMFSRTSKSSWNYHVATAAPVKKNGLIQWMVFDPLRVSSGPLGLEDWIVETNKDYKFTSPIRINYSAADRIGAQFTVTLWQLQFTKNGSKYIEALLEAKNKDNNRPIKSFFYSNR